MIQTLDTPRIHSALSIPPSVQQARADYAALLQRLIETAPLLGYDSIASLPALTEHDLRIILRQRPELFWEAVADSTSVGPVVTHFLGAPDRNDRHALIAITMINILWGYAQPLLLIDLQEEMERRQTEAHLA